MAMPGTDANGPATSGRTREPDLPGVAACGGIAGPAA
jgi:hypothetical protein